MDRRDARRLVNIEGTPPELMAPPSHCQFAPRCSYAFDLCWQEIPPLLPVGVRHEVACFFDVEKERLRYDG